MSINEIISNYGDVITISVLGVVYISAVVYSILRKGEPQPVKQEKFDDLRYMHNKTYSLDDFIRG